MFTQRTVLVCLRKVLTYSQYRVYRVRGIYGISVCHLSMQKNYNNFHSTSLCINKSFQKSKLLLEKPKKVLKLYDSLTVNEFSTAVQKSVGIDDAEFLGREAVKLEWRVSMSSLSERTGQKVLKKRKKELEKKSLAKSEKADQKGIKKIDLKKKKLRRQPPPNPEVLVKRSPVVTIMGHVDHGKTTLLDTLRKSNIVDQEFGGITQHIGAFLVNLPSGDTITFLDTPGHAAFTAMRARGAKVTDIIILVVAADDGVLQQTAESIEHARKSDVPLIVALNKIDKAHVDIERVTQMLMEHNVVPEEAGGDVQVVPISALKGTNIKDLQEAVITQAELMELKGDPKGLVEGHVIEVHTDTLKGKVATVIVQRGMLKKGDVLVAGKGWVKVRSMFNEHGHEIKNAGLSMPVRITGWKELPSAGDEILQVQSEKIAKSYIDYLEKFEVEEKGKNENPVLEEIKKELRQDYLNEREKKFLLGDKYMFRDRAQLYRSHLINYQTIEQHEGPLLHILLKCDVDGSLEAITDTLQTYSSRMCELQILDSKVGEINESDINLAASFNGVIYGFNIHPTSDIEKYAAEKKVPLKVHNIIYRLFECLQQELSKKLPILTEEEIIGEATVLQTFVVTNKGKKYHVSGCRCDKGSLKLKAKYKVLRGDEVIHKGKLSALKIQKADVESVDINMECGLQLSDTDVKTEKNDVIICYDDIEIEQQIDWNPDF